MNMNMCSPVEMRKNLDVVEQLRSAGIDFVAVPAKDPLHKQQLIAQHQSVLTEMIREAEENESA